MGKNAFYHMNCWDNLHYAPPTKSR
jgi:hypothetical protein